LFIYQETVPTLFYSDVKDDTKVFVFEMKGQDLQAMFYNSQAGFSPITVTMIFHRTVN